MGATGEDAIVLLRSIDATLKAMLALAQARTKQTAGGGTIAPDRDLDSQYGDEQVRLNPRDWTGPSCKGRRMSECPAEFLDLLADTYVYFAKKNDESHAKADNGTLKSVYDRRTESRAGTHKAPQMTEPSEEAGWSEESEWQ